MTPLNSKEQRMIGMCCSPEGEIVFSPSPHASIPKTEPVAYGCHSFQSDRKWSSWEEEGNKAYQVYPLPFCMSWAVPSENSQGHEVWVKIRCMYRGVSCLRCFMKSCVLEKGSQATRDIFSKEYGTENMREALWVNTQGKYHLCFFSSRLPLAWAFGHCGRQDTKLYRLFV